MINNNMNNKNVLKKGIGKKAQISIQFNWIFVIIAGSIILLFFGGLVIKQKSASENKFCGTVLNSLEVTLSSVAESSGTEKVSDMPSQEIFVTCEEYGCFGSTNIPAKSFGNIPSFSPGALKGLDLISYSLEWGVPFRVINFLFITNPENRYYLIYSGSSAKALEISDKLPLNMTYELISYNSVSNVLDKNDNKVRLIFFDSNPLNVPLNLIEYPDTDVTALKVSEDGTLNFYEKKDLNFVLTGTSYYVNDVDIVAAVFSERYDNFICAMKKAYKRLNYVSIVNKYRVDKFNSDVNRAECSFIYTPLESVFDDLEYASSQCKDDIKQDCVISISNSDRYIRNSNNELIRESCPLVY